MNNRNAGERVVVAGAGPAGLAAASELAYHGIASIVVEPREKIDHSRPRAKTTSARTMELFRRWGIADRVRTSAPLSTHWNRRVLFCDSVSGEILCEFQDVFGLNAADIGIAAEAGQQVTQPVVEEVLRQHLDTTGLVEFRFGHRLTGLTESVDGVRCEITDSRGVNYVLSTPFLLGCDGHRSVVREGIGASMEGSSSPEENLNLVFTAPKLKPEVGEALHYWILNSAVRGAIGPLDRRGSWWATLSGMGCVRSEEIAVSLLRTMLGTSSESVDIELLSIDRWRPRMMISNRFATDRVFLVGESAHINPPFGGHGFNTSVGDAVNIGWKIAASLQGWGGNTLLSSYEVERRGVAIQTIASAKYNLEHSGSSLRADSEHIRATKSEEFYSLGLVLGYSYNQLATERGTEISVVQDYVPSTLPGGRLPHAWIGPNKALYDDLGRGFTLLYPADADNEEVARFAKCVREGGTPLKLVAAPRRPPFRENEFLIVRPDQHIAWRGHDLTEAIFL